MAWQGEFFRQHAEGGRGGRYFWRLGVWARWMCCTCRTRSVAGKYPKARVVGLNERPDSGTLLARTEFLPCISRTPVFGYFLPAPVGVI